MLAAESFWNPTLSLEVQTAFRAGSALLQVVFIYWVLTPNWQKYFGRRKDRGYAEDSLDPTHHPVIRTLLLPAWTLVLLGVAVGLASPLLSFINLFLCHYFFIRLRWRTLARGMGAPGFMSFWVAAAVFFLEFTTAFVPSLRALALLVLQIDLAIIMLSAGIYKATAGYLSNNGMELGLVNPMWGYWWKFYNKMSPNHLLIHFLNQSAWSTEVLAAFLMVIPQTRILGGLLLMAIFFVILTQIRLGVLCLQVAICGLLFFSPSYVGATYLPGPDLLPYWGVSALQIFLMGYLLLRPIVLIGLYFNFYGKKHFPVPFQGLLEKYTNFFGIILWRVFTVDVVNFYVEIHKIEETGKELFLSKFDSPKNFRFNQVTESIVVTSIFTTLKYYPSQPHFFEDRIIRYSKSLSSSDGQFRYRYFRICKKDTCFESILAAEYLVDTATNKVKTVILEPELAPALNRSAASAHECSKPGSYAPG